MGNAEPVEDKEYEVIEGSNQTLTIGEDEAKFKIDADYSLFENGGKVFVDDMETTEYDSESGGTGSTVITLNKDFVNSLPVGEHTLKVLSNNEKEATTIFIYSQLPKLSEKM